MASHLIFSFLPYLILRTLPCLFIAMDHNSTFPHRRHGVAHWKEFISTRERWLLEKTRRSPWTLHAKALLRVHYDWMCNAKPRRCCCIGRTVVGLRLLTRCLATRDLGQQWRWRDFFMDNENSDSMDCSTSRRHLSLHVAAEPFRRSLCCYGM